MIIEKFEDVVAWQKAKEITLLLFDIFKDNRDIKVVVGIYKKTITLYF